MNGLTWLSATFWDYAMSCAECSDGPWCGCATCRHWAAIKVRIKLKLHGRRLAKAKRDGA